MKMRTVWMGLVVSVLGALAGASVGAEEIRVQVSPEPGNSGYEGTLRFTYGLRNCYGVVSGAFGGGEFIPEVYHYQGKTYQPSDLGMTEFKKRKTGATLEADVFRQSERLGRITFETVTFFSAAGCFTETYGIMKMLGLKDEDYRKNVQELSLQNFSARVRVQDYKIEGKLDEEARQEERRIREEKAKLEEAKRAEEAKQAEEARKAEDAARVASGSAAAVKGAPPAAATSPTLKKADRDSSTSDTRTRAEIERERVEAQKKAYAEQELAKVKADVQRDQEKVQAFTESAKQVGEALARSNMAIGATFLFAEATPFGCPFENDMIGLLYGKSKKPTDHPDSTALTSGYEVMLAFNLDYLAGDPKESATNVTDSKNRRYSLMMEYKTFANLKATYDLQPYVGLGFVSYADFSPKMVKDDSGFGPSLSIGFGGLWNDGWFRMGYNFTTNALDFGAAF